jgi:peptidoglycan hydrolase CwlO-like protein
MVKKGLIGAALGAGTLFLVFGTHAPSYVKTAIHKVKQNAKESVPLPFDIDRAREEIAGLEPAIKDNILKLVRAEVEVKHLDKEISAIRTNIETEKKALLTLRESLKTGEYRLAGHSSVAYTEDEVKADLARRYDSYNNVKKILEAKESTVKAKQSEIVAFRKQLETMMAQKKTLTSKLDEIEARLHQIEATQTANEFQLDGSALARAKESVSDLEKRLEIMARQAELEGRYAETGVPVMVNPGRDVVKEIDNEFAPSTSTTKPGKSL